MKEQTEILISDLIERTRQNLNQAEQLKQKTLAALNKKANAESWSALECVEHLNLYGDFYIPEMAKAMKEQQHEFTPIFKSGLLGNYFAKAMLPREKINKMNSPKDKNPIGSQLDKSTIERFINQQNQLLVLLNNARKTNLNKVKTGITLSNMIKLRLGDTFRVVIYHNQRHLLQANRALKN